MLWWFPLFFPGLSSSPWCFFNALSLRFFWPRPLISFFPDLGFGSFLFLLALLRSLRPLPLPASTSLFYGFSSFFFFKVTLFRAETERI